MLSTFFDFVNLFLFVLNKRITIYIILLCAILSLKLYVRLIHVLQTKKRQHCAFHITQFTILRLDVIFAYNAYFKNYNIAYVYCETGCVKQF